jgi:hypothetical protein
MAPKVRSAAAEIPHSWDLAHWPPDVYPHSEKRAKYIVRAFRDELVLAGALARVGRELVVYGVNFDRWLQRKRTAVPGYSNGCVAARDAAP